MKRVSTAWFTLVELIIVITILAILGTIWFVSFQWYTSNARDTKRTNDLASLISALEAKRAGNSLSVVSFVSWTGAMVSWTPFTASWIAWKANPTTTEYKAWVVDFTLLWISADWFKDPNNVDYSFWASSFKWGVYQLAATLENSDRPESLVKWNYSARVSTWVTVVPTARDKSVLEIVNTADFTKFNVWDLIKNGSPTCSLPPSGAYIKSISSDLKYLTLSWVTATASTNCTVQLNSDEMSGLIWDYSTKTTGTAWNPGSDWYPVKDWDTANLPY